MIQRENKCITIYIHFTLLSHIKNLVLFPWGKSQGMKHEFQGAVVYTRGSQTGFQTMSQWGEERGLCEYGLGPYFIFLELLWFICFKFWGSVLDFTSKRWRYSKISLDFCLLHGLLCCLWRYIEDIYSWTDSLICLRFF